MFPSRCIQENRRYLQGFRQITREGIAGSGQAGRHPLDFRHVTYAQNVAAGAAEANL